MVTLEEAIQQLQKKLERPGQVAFEPTYENIQLEAWLTELKNFREKFGQFPKTVIEEPLFPEVLKNLTIGTKVWFKADNEIFFGQDMHLCRHVDHNIIFEVTDQMEDKGVWLKAPGYGGEPYGNGRIIIYYNQNFVMERK